MFWPSRTVLWILVAVGFIGVVVAGLVTPTCVYSDQPRARIFVDASLCQQIEMALQVFEEEYDAFPAPPERDGKDDLTTTTEGNLVDCLLGKKVWGNSRGIDFIEAPLDHGPNRPGLGTDGGYARLLDSWGQPYQVVMDSNRDEMIANPDARNANAKVRAEASPMLKREVIVYGSGPDGLPGTGDDIPSWRAPPAWNPRSSLSWDKVFQSPQLVAAWLGLALMGYGLVGLLVTDGRTRNRSFNP